MDSDKKAVKPHRPKAPRVRLTLTQDLIDDAIVRNSGHCMWAEAVKAQVPGASLVSVDLQTIRWTDRQKGLRYIYLTPRQVQVSLVKFDQGIRDGWAETSAQLRNAQVIKSWKPGKNKVSLRNGQSMPDGAKAEIVDRGRAHEVPDKIGGQAPPRAALGHGRGQRRAFGLRALEI